jgi:hypothetical protein
MRVFSPVCHGCLRPVRVMVALCLALALSPCDSSAQPAPAKEYQVKAVFLFNFAQFVEWPAETPAGGETNFVIGVLGDDPFGAFLDKTVEGEKVNNRTLVVKRYRRVEDIKDCQILFISRSEAGRLRQILDGLKDRHILTVADMADFAQTGGMIQFATEQNKIRLKINVEAAKPAGLTISSKLLRPAEIVNASNK